MKVNLLIFFDYNNKPDDDKENEISELLMSFSEFCDDNYFEFQCIPRIGERIVAEELIKKWIENKDYKKPCSESQIWKTMYHVMKEGSFLVEEIYHSLNTCTIHCSDIEYKDTE
jgi:hypothetical protein